MLEHIGTVDDYFFFYNTKHGNFSVFRNGKCIANPSTVDRVFQFMSSVGKMRKNQERIWDDGF